MSILANRRTRILIQGITGREAATFTKESLDYGAQIVAGVTPGKGGANVHGVPVFDSVAGALAHGPADATVISVPAPFVKDASLEAIAHGLRLLVIITERVPRQDIVQVLEAADTAGVRVVGPNSLGIITPGETRVGMAGGSADTARLAFSPGPVGIISRSGGMTTEIASMLTQAGVGQSTCVSIGGDPIVGSTFVDLIALYEDDPHTRVVVIFGEPGGRMEEDLADYLRERKGHLPVVAFIAGRFADRMPGVRFGHAGAIVEAGRGSPTEKVAALRQAGALVAERLSDIPHLVHQGLGLTTFAPGRY